MKVKRPLLFTLIGTIVAITFVFILRRDPNLAASLVAFGTLLLAVVTAMMIDNSIQQEKRRRKEELLKEIIQWAEDIRKSSSGSIAPNEIIYDDASMATASQMDFLRLRRTYQDINTKGTYAKAIAKVYRGNLLSVTESVICKLDEIIKILKDCLTTRTTRTEEKHERVEACKISLDSSAQDLIEEATKIKTKDIGKEEGKMSKEGEVTGSNGPTLKDI